MNIGSSAENLYTRSTGRLDGRKHDFIANIAPVACGNATPGPLSSSLYTQIPRSLPTPEMSHLMFTF
jgi:hypothetical protein